MTTARFNGLVSATAQAMAVAYQRASSGETAGRLTCPKCGGGLRFTAKPGEPSATTGRCKRAGCVRWPL